MIKSNSFLDHLVENNLTFYSGVPDSLTSKICMHIEETARVKDSPIIFLPAAHEGIAVAFAIGRYLATRVPGVVFMQNAGIGNIYNPIASLASKEAFDIPLVLIVGWRGEPGKKDEPQHQLQGKLTQGHLKDLGFVIEHINPRSSISSIKNSKILENSIKNREKIVFLFSGGSIDE